MSETAQARLLRAVLQWLRPFLLLLSLSLAGAPVFASDTTHSRVVTLSPHLAELMVTIGALDHLVGVSAYSNFPAAVAQLPRIGDAFAIDWERLSLLEPDLVLAWESGTPTRTVTELKRRGFNVETVRTRSLDDIAAAVQLLGRLTGREADADRQAQEFQRKVETLRAAYAERSSLKVFYQIAKRPLYTVSGEHFASELIALCGGTNVFADLGELAPLVSVEAVLERRPEVMIAGATAVTPDPFVDWRRWEGLPANDFDNFFVVDADRLARPTTRLVDAGKALCERLDEGRRNRQAAQR